MHGGGGKVHCVSELLTPFFGKEREERRRREREGRNVVGILKSINDHIPLAGHSAASLFQTGCV